MTVRADPLEAVDPEGTNLLDAALKLNRREPGVFALLSLDLDAAANDRELMAHVLSGAVDDQRVRAQVLSSALEMFRRDPAVPRASMIDVAASAERNMEPGGEIATLLFARGVHAILGHRVAHALWREERTELALALKTVFSRAFATDIHPGAVFGQGIWLDHGLAFVVGETAVIEDDVSIWHGVTLGSTLKDNGGRRHPRLCRGCTIGADAVILGGIDIGDRSVVAAGSTVLASVPPGTTVAGAPAREKPRSTSSFTGFRSMPTTELS